MLSDEYDLLSSEIMVAAYVQGLQQTLLSESNFLLHHLLGGATILPQAPCP